jgi:type I restriction enzyme M protein
VERPYRFMFDGDEDGIGQLGEDKSFRQWDEDLRSAVLTILITMAGGCRDSNVASKNRDEFRKALLDGCARLVDVKKIKDPQLKLIEKFVRKLSEDAGICYDKQGKPEADADLRDFENVPLPENIDDYFNREVLPHVPDAWIDTSKRDEKDGKVGIAGYEINFNRYFYRYTPPRSLHDIDADLKANEARISAMLNEVAE